MGLYLWIEKNNKEMLERLQMNLNTNHYLKRLLERCMAEVAE